MIYRRGEILKCVLRMWNEHDIQARNSFTQQKCAHVIQVRLFCNLKKIMKKPRKQLTPLLVTHTKNECQIGGES